jgi:hypothetical protein
MGDFGGRNSYGLPAPGANSGFVQTTNSGSHRHEGITDVAGDHDHGGNTQGHSLTAGEVANHQHNFSDLYGLKDDANPGVYDRNGDRLEKYTGWGSDGDADSGAGIFRDWQTDATGNSDPHVHGITSSGGHGHTVQLEIDGSHTHYVEFDNRPAWTALFYIMRIV